MSFGIRVSKPGVDVNTATTKDLFMDTTYPILKIKQSGSGTLSITDGGTDSDTITHSLGYIPKVLVYGQYYNVDSSAKVTTYRRYPIQQQIVGTYLAEFTYTASTTTLVITGSFADESTNSVTIDYFYYIFYDEE